MDSSPGSSLALGLGRARNRDFTIGPGWPQDAAAGVVLFLEHRALAVAAAALPVAAAACRIFSKLCVRATLRP
jgi:hypothetical protein